MNPHNDFPEVLYPGGHRNSHFHNTNPFDIKSIDPCFPHQQIDPIVEHVSGTSRWSSMSRSRQRWFIVGVILLILVMAGAIVGGIMGSDLVRPSANSTDDIIVEPMPTGVPGGLSKPHESSRLAVGYGGNSASNFRLALLQDVDGDLSAIEWRGSKSDHYKIKDRFDGEAPKLDKPINDSPLSIVKYGPDGDLHLFYFSDKRRFSHLVRKASVAPGGDGSWERGSLDAGDSEIPKDFQVSDTLRLSAIVIPSEWTGLDSDSIVLMYWTAQSESSVAMFSSIDPENRSLWQSKTVSLGAEKIELKPHATSSGFLMMAIQRAGQGEDEGEMVGGVRLIWDLDNDSEERTFAILDCTYEPPNALKWCRRIQANWTGKPRHYLGITDSLQTSDHKRNSEGLHPFTL